MRVLILYTKQNSRDASHVLVMTNNINREIVRSIYDYKYGFSVNNYCTSCLSRSLTLKMRYFSASHSDAHATTYYSCSLYVSVSWTTTGEYLSPSLVNPFTRMAYIETLAHLTSCSACCNTCILEHLMEASRGRRS